MERPLFSLFPALGTRLHHIRLAELPTPVAAADKHADKLGLDELWIKCDDVTAADYGGTKLRKLEFLLADAQTRNCSTVLTYGGFGSNHALATSINCRRLGLECIAILTPEPITDGWIRKFDLRGPSRRKVREPVSFLRGPSP